MSVVGRLLPRRKGVPFRETHHIAGEAVRVAEEQNKPLDQLTVAELHELHSEFSDDVVKVSRVAVHQQSRPLGALLDDEAIPLHYCMHCVAQKPG